MITASHSCHLTHLLYSGCPQYCAGSQGILKPKFLPLSQQSWGQVFILLFVLLWHAWGKPGFKAFLQNHAVFNRLMKWNRAWSCWLALLVSQLWLRASDRCLYVLVSVIGIKNTEPCLYSTQETNQKESQYSEDEANGSGWIQSHTHGELYRNQSAKQ